MHVNSCCCIWKDLAPELAGMKVAQLEKLLKRGIPKSTFSPIFRIIEGMTNFCPLCGTKITNTELHLPEPKKEVRVAPKEPKSALTIKCPPCRGTGRVGDGLNCMTCLGTGVLDRSNPNRAKFDPVYAEEQADKMERTNRRIVEKESEIQKNPQPLREDAKPENWGR